MLSWKIITQWPHDWQQSLDDYRWRRAWSRLTPKGLHPDDFPVPDTDPYADWHDEGAPVG